eukprot:3318530-Rhodomonas_salina.2
MILSARSHTRAPSRSVVSRHHDDRTQVHVQLVLQSADASCRGRGRLLLLDVSSDVVEEPQEVV